MTTVQIFLEKTPEENAQVYFEQAKKCKRKLEGAGLAVKRTEEVLSKVHEKRDVLLREIEEKNKPIKKKRWYDKFRHFHTSEGFLVVCGRDATTNEIVIKKHTEPQDLVFHTDKAGSPFSRRIAWLATVWLPCGETHHS